MAKKAKTDYWKSTGEREKYITHFVTTMWDRAEAETTDDRTRWSLAFDLFQGKQDWGDEREEQAWMSRPFLHEFSRIVRKSADALSGLVFEKEDFFQLLPIDLENPGNVEFARIFEKIIRSDVEDIEIEVVTADYFIAAGTAGLGILKVWAGKDLVWNAEPIIEEIDLQEEKRNKKLNSKAGNVFTIPEVPEEFDAELKKEFGEFFLDADENPVRLESKLKPKKSVRLKFKAKVVDPRNFTFEPDIDRIEQSPWQCERIFSRFYQLEPEFESEYLNKAKRKDILKGMQRSTGDLRATTSGYEEQKWGTRDQFDSSNEFTPTVEIFEYCGPLLGKHGEVLEENKHFIVGNGKVLLRDAEIETWTKKGPYITTVLSKSPFKPVGQGIADNAIDQQLLINDLFATFLDMYRLSVYQPVVVDDTALRDPDEVEQGFYPGQIIKTFGKRADEVFSPVSFNNQPGQLIFQVLQQLRVSGEAGAAVDVSSANPSSRARISAKEIQSNDERGDESVLALGRVLDASFVRPLIQKLVELRMQFGLEREPLLELVERGVITQSEHELIAGLGKVSRFNELKRNFKVKVKGFRERLERQAFLRNVSDFLGQVQGLPPEALASVQWNNALEDIVEAFGFDQNRWIAQNTPQDKASEENKLLQNNQLVSNGQEDNDPLELPVHYNSLMQAPTEAQKQHIFGHLQRMQERGEPLPELPPQVQQILGKQAQPQTNGAVQ